MSEILGPTIFWGYGRVDGSLNIKFEIGQVQDELPMLHRIRLLLHVDEIDEHMQVTTYCEVAMLRLNHIVVQCLYAEILLSLV